MDTVLITGGTSGIGYELGKRFAKDNFNIILVARDEEKLRDTKNKLININDNIKVFTIKKDLSKIGAGKEVYDEVKTLNLVVTHLVNNAGFGAMGKFNEIKLEKQLSMIRLNISVLTEITYYFLEDMKKLKRGKILNVASLASFTPGPYMAVYYASKSYVLSFSQALKEELRFSGITVTALCPGPTKSEFSKRAHAKKSILFVMPMSTKRVARIGYLAMKAGISFIVPGLINNVFALWLKLTPSLINSQLVKITSIKTGKE